MTIILDDGEEWGRHFAVLAEIQPLDAPVEGAEARFDAIQHEYCQITDRHLIRIRQTNTTARTGRRLLG